MGGLFSKPKMPSIPQPVSVQLPPSPRVEDEAASNAAAMARWRRRMAYGASDTMLTSGGSVGPARAKTLLGE